MCQNKSCVVVTNFADGQPGFLDFSYRIKSLADHYRLTVVSTFPLTQAELQLPNVNYVVINAVSGRLGWLTYIWRCAALICRLRPHVALLLHSTVAPVAILISSIPTITYWNEHPSHFAPQVEGFSPIKAITRSLIRSIIFVGARCSSLIMPIGEAHFDDLIAHGCNPNQIRMIYMGVDESFSGVALSGRTRNQADPLRLIYVGSVQNDRGRDVMLEAMAIVNKNGNIANLTIVGANPEQLEYCHNALDKLGIVDSVTIHGRVPGHMIPSFMKDADAGLCLWEDLPWYRFNPPTKLFEYLVGGLPVLASKIRTHTQYIQNGVNGLFFDYSSDDLAKTINNLWCNKRQISSMKLQAIKSSDIYLWKKIEPVFLDAVSGVMR